MLSERFVIDGFEFVIRILNYINKLNYFSEKWWCTEYAEEIHDVLRKREFDRFNVEFKAPQIEWRLHVIQYMLDVAQNLKLSRTTLHLGEINQLF